MTSTRPAHGGRACPNGPPDGFCDVFEIRDFKIQRCFIYLDPDYAGKDTARYPWLAASTRNGVTPEPATAR